MSPKKMASEVAVTAIENQLKKQSQNNEEYDGLRFGVCQIQQSEKVNKK